MNRGSVLAFDVIFSIGMILILFIAAALVIHMVVPYLGSNVACIDGQKSQIKEIDDAIENVKLTGITQIMKFKVENCVRCMWYNGTHINFKWTGQAINEEPQSFEVSVPWNDFGTPPLPPDENKCGGGDTDQIAGGQWCTLEISPNRVFKVSGCDKYT